MQNNARIVQFFDIRISGKTRARDINYDLNSPRTIDEIMGELSTLRELNRARKRISENSRQEYRLEDLQENDDHWVLLINVVDTEAAHPVTQKVDGGDDDRQVVELGDDRGLESSSHVVISKDQTLTRMHVALYEKSPSLPFSKAISFLNYLLREAASHFLDDYTFPHPSGISGETIKVYCRLAYYGHPSDEFREELEDGCLKGIRLTSDMRTVRGYDANSYPELVSTEIKMKVGRADVAFSGGNWAHLQKAIRHANALESPYVRVSFEDPSGANHTATISSDTGQLYLADRYVKKRRIEGFGRVLRTSFPVINNGIVEKMLELL